MSHDHCLPSPSPLHSLLPPPPLLSSLLPPSPSPLPLLYSLLPPPPLPSFSFPPKEYARMVQMLQGYCLICTGVRITCQDQSGKGYATTCKIGSFPEKIFFIYSVLLLLSFSVSPPFPASPPPPSPHTHPSPVRNSWWSPLAGIPPSKRTLSMCLDQNRYHQQSQSIYGIYKQ